MTEYEINGKEYEVDYDLDNRIIKVDVDNNDVEKYRRLVGVLDLESGSSEARRVKAREASLNQCAEHKHQAGQTVIQNDIMAHPSRLNSVIARAVDGSKFKLEWYHKNYLDHVYAVSDDDGDILEHYRYTAFGEVQIYNANGTQVATTQIDNHILWNTRRRDEVTGYYLYKFRHYSPELGRWLARDPIGENGGVNLYAFVGNDPSSRWDKLGQSPQCDRLHKRCWKKCWKANPPWPCNKGDGCHYRYCQTKCLAEYMACESGEVLKATAEWCEDHPYWCCVIGVAGIVAAVEPTPAGEAALASALIYLLGFDHLSLTPSKPHYY